MRALKQILYALFMMFLGLFTFMLGSAYIHVPTLVESGYEPVIYIACVALGIVALIVLLMIYILVVSFIFGLIFKER